MPQIKQCDTPHHKMKDKNYIVISIDAEKAFNNIQYLLLKTTLNKVGIEGTHLNIIEAIWDKSSADIRLSGEKLKAFSPKSGTR